MIRGNSKSVLFIVAVALITAMCGQTLSQSRKQATIKAPGRLRTLGQGSPTYSFQSYSYGVGGLQQQQPTTGVLRSSIDRAGSFSLSRTGKSRSSQSQADMVVSKTGVQLKPLGPTAYVPKYGEAPKQIPSLAIMIAWAYLDELGADSGVFSEETNEPVTTLVPEEPSSYRDYMEKGEAALKAGDFQEAYDQFKLASLVGENDPESLINLTHATYAKSFFSYAEAAFYLQQALKRLPELPLVQLQPRAFFGQSIEAAGRYAGSLERLEEHLAESPWDINAHLIRAYFRWFGGDVAAARQALAEAGDSAEKTGDKDAIEVVNIFWDGMVASGKVSGELSGATQPPAAQAPPRMATQPAAGIGKDGATP